MVKMNKQRRIWFITRPERDPKFHRDALLALKEATSDFTIKWARNRKAHTNYERALVAYGIKRDNISNDGSGGRTWAAMLRTFAYCYINEDGYLVPTKSGLSLIRGEKVFENTKKQILTLQIPNAYFLESGFKPKYQDGFKIRPARFLIKLANQKELDFYLTKEEITYFVLTAKQDNELSKITNEILKYRGLNELEKKKIKQQIAEEFDHRERSDKGARDFEKAHSDVAHTFMLICDYTGLAEYVRGGDLKINPSYSKKVTEEINKYDERYPFNTRYLISLQRMAENNGLDVNSYKANRLGTIKPATNKKKLQNMIKSIMSTIPNPSILSVEEIKHILSDYIPPHEAERISFEIKENLVETISADFVESYLNEKDNLAFEDKTGNIFKAIGFDVEMRPKPINNTGTEIEIILKYGDNQCGLIDAKNYKERFTLSANLASHMGAEYIPNYEGYEGRNVNFFGYVTASNFGGVKNLEKICNLAKRFIPDREIKGIIMSAPVLLAFLDYCIEEKIPKEERISLFLKSINNIGYLTFGQLLAELKRTPL
ncbi:restriction endonuclease BpuJI [Laceyella sacchari]|nr:restriction endonuclease BpuJI [Laceyella sacchari]